MLTDSAGYLVFDGYLGRRILEITLAMRPCDNAALQVPFRGFFFYTSSAAGTLRMGTTI